MAYDRFFLFRELLKRDLQSRYAGSFLGAVWAVLQPLWQLALLTFVFSTVLKLSILGERTDSFAIYLFSGLVPWLAVQEGISRAATAITENADLIRKMRFSPQLLVATRVISGLVQSGFAAAVLVVLLVARGELAWRGLPWLLLALPLQVALTTGLGLLLATSQVFVRDTAQVLGFLLNTWFYLTPIIYSLSQVPPAVRKIIELNPMTGIVELYRAALLGGLPPGWKPVCILAGSAVLALWLGRFVFRSLQGAFAEEV